MRSIRLLVLGLLVTTSPLAQAEPLLQPPSPVPVPNDEPESPLVPDAKDTLGGHIIVGGSAAFVVPWGDLQQGTPASDLGPGYGFGLDLGYGLSRSVVIGAWGQYALYADSADCVHCSGSSYAVGPFVRYHLVQGMRFDPWLLAGLGYRFMNVDLESGKGDYSGVEWLRFALGGDYYPFGSFGFGPIVELDMGVFGNRPTEGGDNQLHFTFVGGLRLVFDAPGK